MNRTLFIVNPVSGSGNGRKFFENYLKNHSMKTDFDVKFTEYRNHATLLCSQFSSEYNNIVVCGGDGTLNEVINGIIDLESTNLGIIPVGSGNDFALNFKKIVDYDGFISSIVADSFQLRQVDIGIIKYNEHNGTEPITRRFINSCGIGFDAYVAFLNQNTKKIKGRLSYIYSILVGLVKSKLIRINFTYGDIIKNSDYLLIAIGNGPTAGGGLYLTPGAEIDDNKLNFTFLENTSKLKLVFNLLPKAALNKIRSEGSVELCKYNYASIKLENPYFVHVDGESLGGNVSSIEFNVLHKKLNFIVE